MKRIPKLVFLCLLIGATLNMAAPAQEVTGSLNGRVTDSSGAVIPGVQVTLSSTLIQGERTSVTDEAGNYRFILLPPGQYAVKYELPGFQTLIRESIIVEVSRTTTLNVSLGVASVAETLTVTGESPVVDVQNVNVGATFNQALLDGLPNARDIWAVLRQTPGIQMTRFDVGGSSAGTQTGYRAYGRQGQNWVTLDGVATTEGTSGAGFYYDYGAFSEISISAAGNSAEVAVPGVVTNTVMKTGSNDFKGEVYLDWEDNTFQGKNLTEALTDKGIAVGDQFSRYNDFNFNIGGPIMKDKFWWFFAWHDQYIGLQTQLRQNDGTPGALFTTRIKNKSAKLNYQLNPKNQLTFSMQPSRKLQPFRGGSGSTAKNYIIESTEFQDGGPYWTAKGEWTSVLSSRATLDVSSNLFHTKTTRKAHVQKTPYTDNTTGAIRGGFPGPRVGFRTRWQNYANLAYFTDKFLGGNHDVKFGYGVIYEDQNGDGLGAPGEAAKSPGHVQLFYANGVPDYFQVTDTPNHFAERLMQHYLFIQDKWQLGRRLTLNLGFRFDRYRTYLPESGNPGTGPFSTKAIYPYRHIATFTNPVPRLSFVYDLFGDTRTALKASWGRFAENTGVELPDRVNPVSTKTYRYSWDGTLPVTPAVAARSRLLNVTGQTVIPAIDPDLKNAYTDQYTAGIERELFTDFGVSVNFVRNILHNTVDTIDRAYPTSVFAPVGAIDPGPDGVVGSGDDRRITIFERTVPAREADNILTNFKGSSNYSGIEVSATKRFSNKWQFMSGFEWDKTNGAPPRSYDPNQLVWGTATSSAQNSGGAGQHYTQWGFKMLGTYELPKGFQLSATYDSQKGTAYARIVQFSGANRNILNANGTPRTSNLGQGSTIIVMEPNGSYNLPAVKIFNARTEKTFKITEHQSITGMFDLFNIFNANTVIGTESLSATIVDSKGRRVPRFGRPTTILNPIIFRLGVRYKF